MCIACGVPAANYLCSCLFAYLCTYPFACLQFSTCKGHWQSRISRGGKHAATVLELHSPAGRRTSSSTATMLMVQSKSGHPGRDWLHHQVWEELWQVICSKMEKESVERGGGMETAGCRVEAAS